MRRRFRRRVQIHHRGSRTSCRSAAGHKKVPRRGFIATPRATRPRNLRERVWRTIQPQRIAAIRTRVRFSPRPGSVQCQRSVRHVEQISILLKVRSDWCLRRQRRKRSAATFSAAAAAGSVGRGPVVALVCRAICRSVAVIHLQVIAACSLSAICQQHYEQRCGERDGCAQAHRPNEMTPQFEHSVESKQATVACQRNSPSFCKSAGPVRCAFEMPLDQAFMIAV